MDKDFIERKLPIALDLWFRGTQMQPHQRKAAVESLTRFIVDDLVNDWEMIERAKDTEARAALKLTKEWANERNRQNRPLQSPNT